MDDSINKTAWILNMRKVSRAGDVHDGHLAGAPAGAADDGVPGLLIRVEEEHRAQCARPDAAHWQRRGE